jgi:hypothetical protein
MATLRQIHRYMNERQAVVLRDGRIGKISRVDTFFPKAETIVTVWLRDSGDGAAPSTAGGTPGSPLSGLVKVGLGDVLGTTTWPSGS